MSIWSPLKKASDPTWSQPANDVLVQMVALLDHYFSDENLIKDKFLLKHVRRNKQGYVSGKILFLLIFLQT